MIVDARTVLLNAAGNRIAYATELLQPVVAPDPETHLYWLRNRAAMAADLLASAVDLIRVAETKEVSAAAAPVSAA